MNEIIIDTCSLPAVISGAYEVASVPFIHADRTTDFHVLIYVTEGYIGVTEEEQDYTVQKGELFFLKSGLHHYGKVEIPQGTAWYYIHFRTQQPSKDCQPFQIINEPGNQGFFPASYSYTLTLPKHSLVPSDSSLAESIRDFVHYLNSADPLRRWNLNQKLFHLLSEAAFTSFAEIPRESSLTDQLCHFLADHTQEPFKASDLENHFHLSYKHLAACFKKATGTTIQAYHTHLKMNLACTLLRSTLLPIKEISSQLGYQDMLYFSRVFHAKLGVSPSAYRKQTWL